MGWQEQFLKMVVDAAPNETIIVFDPSIIELAKQLAASLGRDDLKFEAKSAPCQQ